MDLPMPCADAAMPPGYRLAFHEELDSTNAEAMRLALAGEPGGLWVMAASQKLGRGRAGRGWTSSAGNLYASLLLRPGVPLATASQLSLLTGIAVHDAVSALAGAATIRSDLRLKWPNDLLADGAKLGGILLESASAADQEPAVIIGVGINLAHAPADLGRPAACLSGLGIEASPTKAMTALAASMAEWLDRWEKGRAFTLIRQAWLSRAQPSGAAISVRQGESLISGRFLGIDEAGALLLRTESGQEKRITAGDVSLGAGGA
jgi:BirA family transcriptional regulator, biotin operon repressor / biotin---[acetyl-CoA-carboxylase] ligase